ncbi:uncharacterized protein RJT21DRAFT_123410 [Scheffersomyces amazonensis]|uniref:uncharacterized protein n=1 Tax=Scheffersomyces amazonensis TaxID=1078765 RepID=UPI00315CB48F
MKQQYDSIFDNIDKQKVGHLNPEQVAGFLMTSKLNQQDLATVWDLSDIQNTGIFTKVEFAIALFLVNKKLAGGKLPNIVPHTLIESLQQPQQPQPVIEETRAPAVQPIAKQKTAMDDLVDIFGSSSNASPVPAQASIPAQASVAAISPLEQRVTSSSDLTPPAELPKVRAALTGAFKPTSTFGQSLINKQQDVQTHDNLLGDDVHHQSPTKEVVPPPITSDTPPVTSPTKQINYEALRSVPPPPPPSSKKVSSPPTTTTSTTATSSIPGSFPTGGSFQSNYQSPAPPVSESNTYSQNEDLLADTNPEISGQLSQANADIANVSNQIRSLATQTTNLHEKKIRAEQELQRILNTKVEIENKLKQLRSSYDNEVLQVNQVEKNLSNAKEETEALRSQASISEAKFNALSSDLNTKQLAVEELQKQNGSLKEKLGYLNAEIAELEKNVTQKVNEHQNLSNQVAIKKSQVQVAIVKSEELKNQIKSVEESHLKLQSELDEAHIKSQTFEQEHSQLNEQLQTTINQKPTQPSPHVLSKSVVGGVAAGSIIGGVAAAVGHVVSSDHTQEEPQSQAQKEVAQDDDKDLSEINEEDINSKFPDISGTTDGGIDNVTNATSSIVTDDKANDDENETPITSPSNSDFQFPQGSNAAGVVGGLVGMPGVLVGVQRTDSLTSSVQNNAALSVRDDNIEEISDRDTIDNSNLGGDDEDAIPESISTENYGEQEEEEEHENKDITHHNQEDNSDGDKLSSGVESFEIVNGDEARANEAQAQAQAQAHAESQTETEYPAPNLTDETERPSEEGTSRELGAGEEFPPIKELDYEESDSSSETASQDDNFDDAVAELSPSANPPGYEESIGAIPPVSQPPKEVITPGTTTATTTTTTTGPAPTFDDFFNDLQPATQEQAAPNDLFGDDEFSNLEAARDDNVGDEFETKDYGFSDEFTNTTPAANFNSTSTNGNENENTGTGNDEWEQLFAGFGNAAPVESTTSESTTTNNIHAATPIRVSSTNDVAIQELVGMGFSESSALEALQKSNWNLEDATNYLLDSA